MTKTATFLQAFGGGEMSPDMVGRVDDARRLQGAARVRNMIVTPQGPLQRRNGSRFVAEIENADVSRLITFRFSADQSLCVQVSPGYFRFFEDLEPLRLSSTPRTYVASKNFVAANISTAADTITVTGHGLSTGDLVTITAFQAGGGGGAIFNWGVNEFQDYAAIVVDANTIRLALTIELAAAGTFIDIPSVVITAADYRLHFKYQRRDLAVFSGDNVYCSRTNPLDTTPAGGSTVSCAFTAASTTITVASHGLAPGTAVQFAGLDLPPEVVAGKPYFVVGGNTATTNTFRISETYGGSAITFTDAGSGAQTVTRASCWHTLTDDIYEVPNNYVAADLPFLTWDSSFDVLSLANKNRALSELRRFDTTSWEFVEVSFAPQVAPIPAAQLSVTVEPGSTLRVSATDTTLSGGFIVFQTDADHLMADNDVVFWSGGGFVIDGGGGGSGTTFVGDGEFFRVIRVSDPKKFLLRTNDTSERVTLSTVTGTVQVSGTINLRITSLFSENEHTYGVTVVNDDNIESVLTEASAATNNLNVEGASNTVQWNAQTGAARYRVYRKLNGLFGFIGEVEDDGSASFTFKDENLEADLSRTPPLFDNTFGNPASTNYPAAVAHFEQRRLVGGLQQFPQRVMATRTGTESDMSFHIPVQDDDRIAFDIASREAEVVRHIVPLAQLLLLTSATEYRVTPVNSDAITPSSIAVRPQTFIGASPTQPVIVNNTVVFAAERGGHLRELGFNSEQASFITGDLSLRARYLFDGFDIKDIRLAVSPIPIVWSVSSSGKLIGLTYSPEEQIGSFHVHETDGEFESCTVVPEGPYDNLYVVVKRTIDENVVRYIECIQGDPQPAFARSFYVDSGITYEGAATTTIPGLDHLEGETVVALADGVVRRNLTVVGGQITLPVAAALVHVGLPMAALLETFPLVTQLPGFGQGVTKNVDAVSVRVLDSAKFLLAPADTPTRTVPSTGLTDTTLLSKQVPVTLLPGWNQDGAVVMTQDDPLPLTIVCLTIHATSGGT